MYKLHCHFMDKYEAHTFRQFCNEQSIPSLIRIILQGRLIRIILQRRLIRIILQGLLNVNNQISKK